MNQIRRAAILPVTVEIRQGGRQRRDRKTRQRGGGNQVPKRAVGILHHGGEIGNEKQVALTGGGAKGLGDKPQELRADDAAGAPDFGDLGERKLPAKFGRGIFHDGEALGIGGDLAGVEAGFEMADKLFFRGSGDGTIGDGIGGLRRFALSLHRRQDAGGDGGFDRGGRNAQHLRFDDRPLARALLARAIDYHVHQRQTGLGVYGGQHPGGDLDQE